MNRREQDRGPRIYDDQVLDDPVRRTQQMVQEHVGSHSAFIRAIGFANQGE